MSMARDSDVEKAAINEEKTVIDYLPPKLKAHYLQPNGKLLDDKTIEYIIKEIENPTNPALITYIKERLDNQKIGRYSKTLFGVKFGIINGIHGLYAIYKEKKDKQFEVSDPGAYGTIKSAQHLGTKEFHLLKTQPLISQSRNHTFQNEYNNLKALNLTQEAKMTRESQKTGRTKGDLLMKYMRGEELLKMMSDRSHPKLPIYAWPDHFWLEVTLKVIHAVIELDHILHRDLKLENIIYDMATGASIVDFGHSKARSNTNFGNYLCLEGYNAPENFNKIYTEKSEIFALGTLIQELLFNQVVRAHLEEYDLALNYKYYEDPKFIPRGSKTLFEQDINLYLTTSNNSLTIKNYCQKMRSEKPELRPTRYEVLEFFTNIYEKYFANEIYATQVAAVRQIQHAAMQNETLRLKKANQIITKQTLFIPLTNKTVEEELSPKEKPSPQKSSRCISCVVC